MRGRETPEPSEPMTGPAGRHPFRSRLLVVAPIAALVALFIVTGARGVDLGLHWDEMPWHIDQVRGMARTGVFLPHSYIYPSLSKWLVLLPALPAALHAALVTEGDPGAVQRAMSAVVDAPDYLLSARLVFLTVSSLAMVWIYGAALALRRKPWEAFVAAACLGLSWEYAYHARWVANDCILTQFAAAMLLCLALFQRTRRPRWLYLSAVAVGLGVGAKSPGVVLLLPVTIASVLSLPLRDVRRQVSRLAAVGVIAFVTFLVTTPGLLLEPYVFLTDSHRITAAYSKGHGAYTVTGGWQHARLVLTYLAVDFFAPFRAVSIATAAATVAGGVAWARRDRRFAAVLLASPIVFLVFFCRYNVMIVRNYLLLTPFLALMAARGFAALQDRRPGRAAPAAVAAALLAVAVFQGAFLVRAGEGIRHHDMKAYVAEAITYAAARPGTRFRLSPGVRALAVEQKLTLPANVQAPVGAPVDAVIFFGQAENANIWVRHANDPWLTEAVFGPREMNYNWYASWVGRDRVLVMTLAKARANSVPIAQ
jgi:hypothetical protein